MRRTFLIGFATLGALASVLGGCGFQLRGTASLPYESLYVAAPRTSAFAIELRRAVRANSKTRLVDDPKEAQATLQLVNEAREKVILSLSGGGRVREFQLRYRMTYRMVDRDSKELRPATQIALQREVSYSDNNTLAKETEESLLYRDMQSDAIAQLLRQLQTLRPGA